MTFRSIRSPILFVVTLLCGVVLHETGHLITTLLTGGTVFDVALLTFTPHVTVSPSHIQWIEAFRAASGSGIVVLIALPALWVFGTKQLICVQALGWFSFIEAAGWCLSILFPDGSPNDASWFLQNSHVSAPWLFALCGIIGVILLRLLLMADRGSEAGLGREQTSVPMRLPQPEINLPLA